MVKRINASGRTLSAAQYVYYYEEAFDPFYAVVREASWIMDAIPTILEIRGTLKFAVVGGSTSPFQVSSIGDDTFVIMIDERAFYGLMKLSLRIQSLPPLANLIKNEEKSEPRDYQNKFLLDITKDIVFHYEDASDLISGKAHRSVYQAAITYILGHEIAHVAHRHLEFLQSNEFPQFCVDDTDRALTLRTLELDADSSATSSVVDVFERFAKALEYSSATRGGIEKTLLLRKHYVLGAYIALIYLGSGLID